MPTQEERITALERTTREYRPVLQNFAYELIMIKGLVTTQTDIAQELKEDMNASFKQLVDYQIETERQIDTRFNQTDMRLDKIEEDIANIKTAMATKEDLATMATKEDLAAMATKEDLAAMATKEDLATMENRILDTLKQLLTTINPQRPPSQ